MSGAGGSGPLIDTPLIDTPLIDTALIDTLLIDTAVRHRWADEQEIVEFLPAGWRDWVGVPGSLPGGRGARPLGLTPLWTHPRRAAHAERPATVDDLLAGAGPGDRLVLAHGPGLALPASTNAYLAREVVRAVNDWTVQRWLTGTDPRLLGTVLVPNQVPDEAAAEIRRVGGHPRVVAATLGANGTGKPFGHPMFHPIFGAAADLDLPVVLTAGLEAHPDVPGEAAAAGLPATHTEYRVFSALPLQGHLYSLVAMGVFEKFPTLRVLLSGAGVSWLSTFAWRFEATYKGLRKEIPWVRRRPSEYLARHVWIGTDGEHPAEPERLRRLVAAAGPAPDRIVFGSGRPDPDATAADDLAGWMPPEHLRGVRHGNAADVLRLPAADRVGAGSTC